MASSENLAASIAGAPLAPDMTASFNIRIDESAGIIRSESRGIWTLAQVEDYVAQLSRLIDDSRRRFGRARVLADRRKSSVQVDAVLVRLGEAHATLFAERDRFALIVASSIAKGQSRRLFRHAGSQAFLSYAAPELWLTAWP